MRVGCGWAGYESDESADELAIMNVSQVSDPTSGDRQFCGPFLD